MEDVLAIVLIFGGGALVAIAFSPIGRALADRIRGGPRRAPGGGGDSRELGQVTAELQDVRREVAELSERMDFSERMLAQQRDAQRIAPGGR